MKYCFEYVCYEFKKKIMYFIVLLYKLWMDMYDNICKGYENNIIYYCYFFLNSWFIGFCKLISIYVKEMCFDIKYFMWLLK